MACLSQRYLNSEESDASRCRIVLPPSPRCASVVAPGDDVRARHGAKLLRPHDAGEAHEIPHRVFVGAAGARVAEIGEPLDLGRHVGEPVKLGGGQQPVAGSDPGRELVGIAAGLAILSKRGGRVVHNSRPCFLLLIKSVIKSKMIGATAIYSILASVPLTWMYSARCATTISMRTSSGGLSSVACAITPPSLHTHTPSR